MKTPYRETPVSKRTFQPNNRRRAKTHGFRLRMRTRAGGGVLGGGGGKGPGRVRRMTGPTRGRSRVLPAESRLRRRSDFTAAIRRGSRSGRKLLTGHLLVPAAGAVGEDCPPRA